MRKSKKRKVKRWYTPKVLKKSKINLVFSGCTHSDISCETGIVNS